MDYKTIKVDFDNNKAHIKILENRIYLGITDIFREEMLDVLQNDLKELIIDLGNVAVMNSSGLGVLIMARDILKKNEGKIKLTNLQPLMQDIFSRMRLDTLFEIPDSTKRPLNK